MKNIFKVYDFPSKGLENYDKKFVLLRECGPNEGGIIKAVALAFIEQLIFAQGTRSNNIYFIEELLENLQARQDLYLFSGLFSEILEQKANHEVFASSIRTDHNFQNQFAEFCKILLNIQKRLTLQETFTMLEKFSRNFNVSISFYNGNYEKVKKFPFAFPLKLLIFSLNSKFYIAYKSCYNDYYKTREKPSKIRQNPRPSSSSISLQRLLDNLVNSLPSLSLDDNDKQILESNLQQLSLLTSEPFKFELSLYEKVLSNPCISCNDSKSFPFSCGCCYCLKCLKDLDFLGQCLICEAMINRRDNSIILISRKRKK